MLYYKNWAKVTTTVPSNNYLWICSKVNILKFRKMIPLVKNIWNFTIKYK